jgi:hypothetical protein
VSIPVVTPLEPSYPTKDRSINVLRPCERISASYRTGQAVAA